MFCWYGSDIKMSGVLIMRLLVFLFDFAVDLYFVST